MGNRQACNRITSDVCVIGGGPAGSTLAWRLACLGFDVCLVESRTVSRPHVAATLAPAILSILDYIGVRARVESEGFIQSGRAWISWSDAPAVKSVLPGFSGYHVDRNSFDSILLNHAASHGVKVLLDTRALCPQRVEGGGWTVPLNGHPTCNQVVARVVVDSTGGRHSLLGRRVRRFPSLMALHAQWSAANGPDGEAYIEAGESEWFWCAPIDRHRSIVTVFTDPKLLSKGGQDGLEATYQRLIQRFLLLRHSHCVSISGRVHACDASFRSAESVVGTDFIKVGDAALSLEPLSSQGIQTAMSSSLQAAVVINTIFRCPGNADFAIRFYQVRQEGRARAHLSKTALFYQKKASLCDHPFWADRGRLEHIVNPEMFRSDFPSIETTVSLSPDAEIEDSPVMEGDFIKLKPTLQIPGSGSSVAFVGGVEIVPLIRRVSANQTVGSILEDWSGYFPPETALGIFQWLWRRSILVPSEQSWHHSAPEPNTHSDFLRTLPGTLDTH